MKREIYIAVNLHGYGVKMVMGFHGKEDLYRYAQEVLSRTDHQPYPSDSIGTILEKMNDMFPVCGANHGQQISKAEAIKYIKEGSEDYTWIYL